MKTIAAISTALNHSGISIIRLSGPDAINIVSKLYLGRDLNKVNSHTINFGKIHRNGEIIDEVLVSVMRKPNSFTKEDVVEINCHGGIAVTNIILKLVLQNGASLADPGEFTKRAFLNGRIDLIEAEGIMDLIEAETEIAHKYAITKLNGATSNLIKDLRTDLLNLIANIEVNIDYPEYEDAEIISREILKPHINKFKLKVINIINESNRAKLLSNGINTAIIGLPNVGKSSLLNALLNEEKAIVTNIAGTTRDFVEGKINLDGLLLNLIDTAGIRDSDNVVEKIGISRAIKIKDEADLILMVLDSSKELSKDERNILNSLDKNKTILIANKNDLAVNLDLKDFSEFEIISLSSLNKKGIMSLKEKIINKYDLTKINNYNYLTKIEDILKLEQILIKIEEININIDNKMPVDLLEIDIKEIWTILGSIIGANYDDELVDQLFKNFCLGK